MRDALFDPASAYPRRVAFGLPHNYYFSSQNHKFSKPVVEVVPDKKDQGHDRRASPLILHVQEISEGCYAAVATVFPSIFLPMGEGILIKRAKQMDNEQNVPRNILFAKKDWYKELFDFLESKDPANPGKMRFHRLDVVRPEVSVRRSA
jgi:CRISPR/Cas system CMR-associated protein Cmr1 (group 7 of RAMP superfamily)